MADRDLCKWELMDDEWKLLKKINTLLVVSKEIIYMFLLLTFINNNLITIIL